MTPPGALQEFETREYASAAAMAALVEGLRAGLAERGKASLAASGGSTPARTYELLSHVDLDWASIAIALVDERWVDPGEDGSNETFVRDTLMQNHAAPARFVGMKTAAASPFDAVEDVTNDYAALPAPFDAVLLGLGTDGHTASWHPHTHGLETAIGPHAAPLVTATRAKPSSVTGAHLDRMTLTLPAIASARRVVLLMTGDDKRATLEAAAAARVEDMPVRALLDTRGVALDIIWAP